MPNTRPKVRIHNLETGEIVDRAMTDAEYAEFQAAEAERVAKATAEAEAAAKREAVIAALAAAAGLEVDEVKAALGA